MFYSHSQSSDNIPAHHVQQTAQANCEKGRLLSGAPYRRSTVLSTLYAMEVVTIMPTM